MQFKLNALCAQIYSEVVINIISQLEVCGLRCPCMDFLLPLWFPCTLQNINVWLILHFRTMSVRWADLMGMVKLYIYFFIWSALKSWQKSEKNNQAVLA